jgi:hypothetical protein
VELSINGNQVDLPDRHNVHKLLQYLCRNPHVRQTGRKLRNVVSVSNVSQEAACIKTALEKAWPGAGGWLETKQYTGWVPGHAPTHGDPGDAT